MHDASILFHGKEIENHIEDIREAAHETGFNDNDMAVTDVEVDYEEEFSTAAPNGDDVSVPPMAVVMFTLDLPEGVDYAKAGNSEGVEIDLHWKFTGNLNPDIEVPDVNFNRTKQCDHPEDQRQAVKVSTDYCGKCEGPAIDVSE